MGYFTYEGVYSEMQLHSLNSISKLLSNWCNIKQTEIASPSLIKGCFLSIFGSRPDDIILWIFWKISLIKKKQLGEEVHVSHSGSTLSHSTTAYWLGIQLNHNIPVLQDSPENYINLTFYIFKPRLL